MTIERNLPLTKQEIKLINMLRENIIVTKHGSTPMKGNLSCSIVGGFVRDKLLGKKVGDIDIVIPNNFYHHFIKRFDKLINEKTDFLVLDKKQIHLTNTINKDIILTTYQIVVD